MWKMDAWDIKGRGKKPSLLVWDMYKFFSCQICLEMQVNEMHAPYDKHHKVSSFLKCHQNTHNSVKY